MKKIILSLIILIALMMAVPYSSFAGNGHGHGRYKNHPRGSYYHGNYHNNRSHFTGNFFYGGHAAYYPTPYVYYPPPVVYGPPAYYAPAYPPVTGNLFFGITVD